MDKKNVLVLFGGVSPEHEISKISVDTVVKALPDEKYKLIPVYITKEGKWLLYDGTIDQIKNVAWEKFGTPAILSPDRVNKGLLRIVGDKVKTIPVDVVFPVLHGENGEDGTVQGLCALAGIPCVGCGVLASAVSMDKAITKVIASKAGLAQAKYLVFHKYELDEVDEVAKRVRYKIGYPCFVKPASAGSSIGISKVTNKKELLEAFEKAIEFSDKIVVEKAVKGREIECAVLGNVEDVQVAPVVGEVVAAAEFYDYDAKYHNAESKTLIPAPISEEVAEKAREMAATIFKAVNGSGLSRVDFFLDEDNNLIFNEINTVPGFTSISMFAMLWDASGTPWPNVLDYLIDIALRQNNG